jgi:RNA polymerase-associated protein LEO1
MRWRYAQNAAGEPVKQSNARFVRWSDGSLQLMVGSETYDVAEAPNENIQLFLTHERDLLLECHGILGDRLVFRPASFDSASHKRLTAGLADSKYYREKKVKLINTTVNPETEKVLSL